MHSTYYSVFLCPETVSIQIKTLKMNSDLINGSLKFAHETNDQLTSDLRESKETIAILEIDKKRMFTSLMREKDSRHKVDQQCQDLRTRLAEAQHVAVSAIAQLDDVALEQVQLQNQVVLLKRALHRKDEAELKTEKDGTFYEFIQLRRTVYLLEFENKLMESRLRELRDKTKAPDSWSTIANVGKAHKPTAAELLLEKMKSRPPKEGISLADTSNPAALRADYQYMLKKSVHFKHPTQPQPTASSSASPRSASPTQESDGASTTQLPEPYKAETAMTQTMALHTSNSTSQQRRQQQPGVATHKKLSMHALKNPGTQARKSQKAVKPATSTVRLPTITNRATT